MSLRAKPRGIALRGGNNGLPIGQKPLMALPQLTANTDLVAKGQWVYTQKLLLRSALLWIITLQVFLRLPHPDIPKHGF